MRRGSHTDSGSLDLLLDTICNAFGGIVFIALLLAVLAQEVRHATDAPPVEGFLPPSVLKLRSDMDRLTREVQGLREQAQALEKTQEIPSRTPLEEAYARAYAEHLSLQEQAGSGAEELARLQRENRDDLDEISRLSARIDALGERISQVKRDRTEEFRLPVSQDAPQNVRQFWMFVVEGRLHLVDSLQVGQPFHSDIVILVDLPDKTIVTVRNEDGQLLAQGSEQRGKLRQFLQTQSPDRVMVQLFVDKQSFREFNVLKRVLVEKGYRYFFQLGEPPITFVQGNDFEQF